MDMRFGTWTVMSLYRAGSLKTVSRGVGKCKLDLVGAQEIRLEKGVTERAEDYTFFCGEGNEDRQLGTDRFFHTQENVSAVSRVEFVSDRMLYVISRGCWCNIIVLNLHAPCEDKSDDVKDNLYGELGRVFDQLPRYDIKTFLGDFYVKVGREDIFKPKVGNDSSHKISYHNGVRVENFATSKNLLVKGTMFRHRSIHK
jgi:hypothetical protein